MTLLQRFDLQIAIPNRSLGFAVEALETNGTAAGVVFERDGKFVRRAVGVLAFFGPVVEVGVDDFLAVEKDGHEAVFAGDGEVVPFTDGLRHGLGRRAGIVDGGHHAVLAAVR